MMLVEKNQVRTKFQECWEFKASWSDFSPKTPTVLVLFLSSNFSERGITQKLSVQENKAEALLNK